MENGSEAPVMDLVQDDPVTESAPEPATQPQANQTGQENAYPPNVIVDTPDVTQPAAPAEAPAAKPEAPEKKLSPLAQLRALDSDENFAFKEEGVYGELLSMEKYNVIPSGERMKQLAEMTLRELYNQPEYTALKVRNLADQKQRPDLMGPEYVQSMAGAVDEMRKELGHLKTSEALVVIQQKHEDKRYEEILEESIQAELGMTSPRSGKKYAESAKARVASQPNTAPTTENLPPYVTQDTPPETSTEASAPAVDGSAAAENAIPSEKRADLKAAAREKARQEAKERMELFKQGLKNKMNAFIESSIADSDFATFLDNFIGHAVSNGNSWREVAEHGGEMVTAGEVMEMFESKEKLVETIKTYYKLLKEAGIVSEAPLQLKDFNQMSREDLKYMVQQLATMFKKNITDPKSPFFTLFNRATLEVMGGKNPEKDVINGHVFQEMIMIGSKDVFFDIFSEKFHEDIQNEALRPKAA